MRRLVRTRGVAEDIVQEAYLRTYASEVPVSGEAREDGARPYLFSVARNLASKARRHDRVVDAYAAQYAAASELHGVHESPEDAALADERIRLLNEAVGRLPPQCRAAFTLRMFQDRSYKEIATYLGISRKTVEKHIALGVRQVHAALNRRFTETQPP